MEKSDFLVIGGGIAGLSFALKASERGTVNVLFKGELSESSTAKAQGGIAAVAGEDDNFTYHIEDTLTAGVQLGKRSTIELVVKEAPERINEVIALGVNFDLDTDSKHYHLHQEGGHSRRRIFHAADATGYEIQRALLEAVKANSNIKLFSNCSAINLITTTKQRIDPNRSNKALGAYVLVEDQRIQAFLADKTLVATGAAGKVYLYTSNPDVASGDGIAMCYRAGTPVANMEFFQFHPTCLYHPKAKSFLITEAMRGEGAILRRQNGEPFMAAYHELKELAPRDIVARAIDNEMKTHGEDYVLLDISHREDDFLKEHFPNIYEKCLSYGYDLTKEPLPVVPAAHYCCGGVVSDSFGRTNVQDLYVAGECSHTGLHGANRLASNSLLEGLVFGCRAGEHAREALYERRLEFSVPGWDSGGAVASDEQVIISQNWDEIRRFMWNYVGIVRSNKRLQRALRRSDLISSEINDYYWNFTLNSDLLELRNLSLVAELIIKCALQRKESRGLHYNIDYPELADRAEDTLLNP